MYTEIVYFTYLNNGGKIIIHQYKFTTLYAQADECQKRAMWIPNNGR